MKTITSITAIFLFLPLAQAQRERCAALEKKFIALTTTPTDEDLTYPKARFAANQLSTVLTEIKNIEITYSSERQQQIENKLQSVNSWRDLQGFFTLTNSSCTNTIHKILMSLVNTINETSLPPAQETAALETLKSVFRNPLDHTLLAHKIFLSSLKKLCEGGFKDKLGLKCAEANALYGEVGAFAKEIKSTTVFTFKGRLLYYWDKIFRREHLKDPTLDPFERYYDLQTFLGGIKKEFEGTKKFGLQYAELWQK